MLENVIRGNIGIDKDDIAKICLLASDDKKINAIYVIYNNGDISRINRNLDEDYSLFTKNLQTFLKGKGATPDNKGKNWFVTEKTNSFGINYDELDKKYELSIQKEEEEKKQIEAEDKELLKFLKTIDDKKQIDLERIKEEKSVEDSIASFLNKVSETERDYSEQEIIEKPFVDEIEKARKKFSIKNIKSLRSEFDFNTNTSIVTAFLTGINLVSFASNVVEQNYVFASIFSVLGVASTMLSLHLKGERKELNNIINDIVDKNSNEKEEGGVVKC